MTTGPSEVDPAVLAGEPDSVHELEGGDDDLAVAPGVGQPDGPSAPAAGEWSGADALLEGQPTELGE